MKEDREVSVNLQGLPQAHAVSQDAARALGRVGRLDRLTTVVPDELDSCYTTHRKHTQRNLDTLFNVSHLRVISQSLQSSSTIV